MLDEIAYIDEYLRRHFNKVYSDDNNYKITVGDFINYHPTGIFLITMPGHITCAKDGVIYDTFDPSDRYVWDAYRI